MGIDGIAPLFAKLAVESGGDGVTLVFIRSLLALPPLFLIILSKGIGFHLNKKLAGRVFVAAALLNALKVLGGIDDNIELISPTVIEPVQRLKVQHMGSINPRLHTDEVLMALAICAVSDPKAKLALEQLDKLKDCEIHSTVMLSHVDERTFKTLGMHVTCEPQR